GEWFGCRNGMKCLMGTAPMCAYITRSWVIRFCTPILTVWTRAWSRGHGFVSMQLLVRLVIPGTLENRICISRCSRGTDLLEVVLRKNVPWANREPRS